MRRLALLPFVFAAACGIFHRDNFHEAQQLVDSIMQRYPDIARLTIHATPTGESKCRVIASSNAARLGTASDPEDLQAMETGLPVVIEADDGLDVTVPVLPLDGKATASVGVTLRKPVDKDKGLERAKHIAKVVADAALSQPIPLW